MIADAAASLADWIAARPWSNGRVGVIGVSYPGDTAMLSLAQRNHHITAERSRWASPSGSPSTCCPPSVLFHAGDRIRIAIAAADPVSFQLMPANGTASYRIGHRGTSSSFVELPVVR